MIRPQTSMREVLEQFPGAQRALFRRYHIGGCSNCGFRPDESLEEVCRRNTIDRVEEVIEHIQSSHEQDRRLFIAPSELAERRAKNEPMRLLDIRSREEWEATRIDDAHFMTQETMREILGRWPREELFVIYDHRGGQSLDAAAYFIGQGFKSVRCLEGGIDAWAREIDSNIPRYRLEKA